MTRPAKPLALLAMMNAAAGTIVLALLAAGASPAPLLVQLVVGILAMISLVIVWRRFGRPFLSPASAARLPLYLFWKLPMYLGLAKRGPQGWLRAGR